MQTVTAIKHVVNTGKVRIRAERAARKAVTAAGLHPRRRSERSQGMPAPNYCESDRLLTRADNDIRHDRRTLQANITEEIYSWKHVEALGSCKTPWELFIDGYDSAGNRIYDKVNGQTCHQCRQKTLGKRTSCSSCNSLQGVFCGDCLYMRYGENVDEVVANPDWKCPNCRDLCNCSFHRTRKGWAPTGTLYRRAIADGFKSVAHCLVLSNLNMAAKPLALHLMPKDLSTEVQDQIADDSSKGKTSEPVVEIVEAHPAAIEDAQLNLESKSGTVRRSGRANKAGLMISAPKRKSFGPMDVPSLNKSIYLQGPNLKRVRGLLSIHLEG